MDCAILRGEHETPDYVRDNIDVSLPALANADFAVREPLADFEKLASSEYVASQGDFALRFAREIETKLRLPCCVELSTQTDFSGPLTRIKTDQAKAAALGGSEAAACNELVSLCKGVFGSVPPK